uniref:Uncharacterized protein n=1 Tax=Romanomermis culicivorax TaxID=13658 RepID=A0A915IH57_ROMCU
MMKVNSNGGQTIADQEISEDIRIILRGACLDSTLTIRRQGIETLTCLLQNQECIDQNLESTYLNCVFPCLADRESSVVDKTVESICSTIFDRLLKRNFHANDQDYMKCWRLLHTIEKSRPLIRYLSRFIQKYSTAHQSSLAKAVKNIVELVVSFHGSAEGLEFEPYVNAAWMVLAETSKFVNFSPFFALDIWLNGSLVSFCVENDPNNQILNYVCKLMLNRRSQMVPDETKPLITILIEKLVNYRVNPENIASILNLITNLDENLELFQQLSNCCKEFLSNLVYKGEIVVNDAIEEEIIRRLVTLGEVSLLQPPVIDKQLVFIVQVIIASNGQRDSNHWTTPGSQSGENYIKKSLIYLNERIRAVAVTTLGKLCLQDEDSAKRCVAALAFELANHNNDAYGKSNSLLQNNVIIVLSDMCIRYTSLVDRHVETLAECMRFELSFCFSFTGMFFIHFSNFTDIA